MQLFYNEDLTANNIILSTVEARHIIRVLRQKVGDCIQVCNGKGVTATAVITELSRSECKIHITKRKEEPPVNPFLHIACAPTKKNDRFELFIEKATEVGISFITPMISTHSERKSIPFERFQKIAIGAMKQSLKCYFPVINKVSSFTEIVKSPFEGDKYIAWCGAETSNKYSEKIDARNNVLVLIGPEGGFTKEEVLLAEKKGFSPVSFGKERLRTETAAVVACVLFNQVVGRV